MMNHEKILQVLIVVMVGLLLYVLFNYDEIIIGGFGIMIPNAYLLIFLLLTGGLLTARVFFKVGIKEAYPTEKKVIEPVKLTVVKEEAKEEIVEMSLEDYSTLQSIFEKHKIKK